MDLLKVSPLGKSLILTVETLEGGPLPNIQVRDGVLMETRLILKFIASEYGGNELWEPESEEDKRRDEYFQEFAVVSLIGRVDQPLVFEIIPQALPFPFKQLLNLILHPVAKILIGFLEDFLNSVESELTDEKPWFAGKKMGISDFCMAFLINTAVQRGYVGMTKYPKIIKWNETILARVAFQNAVEKGGGKEKYDLNMFGLKG